MQAMSGHLPARLPPLPPHLMPSVKLMSTVTGAPTAADGGSQAGQLVSRILQIALGLFVTTMELPSLPLDQTLNPQVGFDCDFSTPCRWSSIGSTPDRWRLAKGEPDALLWMAATGTMVLPGEPFTLIEVRGGTPGDMLTSDVIGCQRDSSLFSFTYWTIGQSNLEICLLDIQYRQFNCTGMLQSSIQPGKVALKLPPIQHPFHIAIIPSSNQGILVIDDIKYDAKYCGLPPPVISPFSIFPTAKPSPEPIFTTTTTTTPNPITTAFPLPFITQIPPVTLPEPETVTLPEPETVTLPWTAPTIAPFTFLPSSTFPLYPITPSAISTTTEYTIGNRVTEPPIIFPNTFRPPPIIGGGVYPYVTQKPIVIEPEPMRPLPGVIEYSRQTTTTPYSFTTMFSRVTSKTELPPFDLMIIGNLTSPLHDRRRGRLIDDTGDLLCDFANNFPCFWGAIPSLEESITNHAQLPSYPAAVVIQGSAMFTSDPIRCQTGEGKLLFRYWTNGRVLIKVCAMGFNSDSPKIQCVEEVAQSNSLDDTTLAVFELANEIREPFTLNILPIWEKDSRNNYMVIDEIAYIGECNLTILNEIGTGTNSGGPTVMNSKENTVTGKSTAEEISTEELVPITMNPEMHIIYTPSTHRTNLPINKITLPVYSTTIAPYVPKPNPRPKIVFPTARGKGGGNSGPPLRPIPVVPEPEDSNSGTSRRPGTRYPFSLTTSTTRRPTYRLRTTTPMSLVSTTEEVYPGIAPRKSTLKNSFSIPYTTTQRYITTTEEPTLDYCKLLNCDFNDNACNYLNHGLTKIAWTLRTKGYGFPLSRNTDLRPSIFTSYKPLFLASSNGQFISTVLGPGDFAILESPRFNLTQGINVLLFQYFRPSHSSTIRLCMGSRYSKPLRTVSSFLQCPPILRSLTSKNAFKWNSVHIQLPPGTSHFYLIAHNLDRSSEKVAIAIDNIRVAICDPRTFDPSIVDSHSSHEQDEPSAYQEEEPKNNDENTSHNET